METDYCFLVLRSARVFPHARDPCSTRRALIVRFGWFTERSEKFAEKSEGLRSMSQVGSIPSAPPLYGAPPFHSAHLPVLFSQLWLWMMTLPARSFYSSPAAARSRCSHHTSHRACRCVPNATDAQSLAALDLVLMHSVPCTARAAGLECPLYREVPWIVVSGRHMFK